MNIKIDNRQKYSLQLAAKQREVGELQRQYSTLQVKYNTQYTVQFSTVLHTPGGVLSLQHKE